METIYRDSILASKAVVGFDEKRDQDRAARCSDGRRWGNGYWRFCHLELAEAKFDELAAQPQSVVEEGQQQAIRAKARERMTKRKLGLRRNGLIHALLQVARKINVALCRSH